MAKPGRPKKVISGGGEIPIPFTVDLDTFKRTALAQPIQAEIDRVAGYIDELRRLLVSVGGTPTRKPGRRAGTNGKEKTKATARGTGKPSEAEIAENGKVALKLLKDRKTWVAWKEIKAAINSQYVKDALMPYLEAGEVVKDGNGKAVKFRMKP